MRAKLYFAILIADHRKVFREEEESLADTVRNSQYLLIRLFPFLRAFMIKAV